MTLGDPEDVFEAEADRTAAEVVLRIHSPAASRARTGVWSQHPGCEGDGVLMTKPLTPAHAHGGTPVGRDFQLAIDSGRSRGQPLPGRTRADMEAAFGADFTSVRIHADSHADRLARSVGARSFTSRGHVFFRQGDYEPSSRRGEQLIAHELTHVLQQSAGETNTATIQRAVGFELEDQTWSVFSLKTGRSFVDPASWFGWGQWLEWGQSRWDDPIGWGRSLGRGNIAPPRATGGSQSEYTGENIYQNVSNKNHINNLVGGFNLESAVKKGKLYEGEGFRVEPDGPYHDAGVRNRMDLEFVTDPFPETEDGLKKLELALGKIKEIVLRLSPFATGEYKRNEEFVYNRFVTPDQHGFGDQSVYLYGGKSNGSFKVQATSGVALSQLPEIMETLGTKVPGETEEQQALRRPVRLSVFGEKFKQRREAIYLGPSPARAQKVLDQLDQKRILDPLMDVRELKGFFSLALMYIVSLANAKPAEAREGIKVSLPLLSRYSFVSLFKQVPERTRNAVKSNAGILALDAGLKVALEDIPGKASDPMIGVKTLYKGSTAEEVPALVQALKSFTREEWINKIVSEDKDLLTPAHLIEKLRADPTHQTAASKYGKSIAIYLRGHGDTKSIAGVEGQKNEELAIVENRGIAPKYGEGLANFSGLNVDESIEFAKYYFSWLISVKEGQIQKQRLEEDAKKARTMNIWG